MATSRPEDIIVDPEGVTRVAGLGLAKTPESVAAEVAREATGPIPLGDPRQAEGPAAVRADLRGLGRTLVPPPDRFVAESATAAPRTRPA